MIIRTSSISAMIFALMLHSGCSFLFVKGPPDNHAQMATFDCSESRAWPVFDTVWAALNGLGAVSAASGPPMPQQNQQQGADRDTVMAVGFTWLVVSGASAIFGYNQVGACNKAKRERDERYFGQGVASPTPALRPVSSAAGASSPARAIAPTPTPAAAAPAPAAAVAPATPGAAPAATSTAPPVPASPAPASPGPTTAPARTAPATPPPASRGSAAQAPAPSGAPSPSGAPPSGPTTSYAPQRFSAMSFAVRPPPRRSLIMR
jgi:hypothetical protein